MAQFRGGVIGNRGEATRLGTKSSGLYVYADGWNKGITIKCSTDSNGRDRFCVWETGGSNGALPSKLLMEIIDEG